MQQAKSRIPQCFSSLESVGPSNDADKEQCDRMSSTLHVFSAEIMVELEEWDEISKLAQVRSF